MGEKIPIKTKEEIKIMREGGKILGEILQNLKNMAEVNMDAWDLEQKFMKMCQEYNVRPACKDYAPIGFPPFPTGLCLSIDDESVHCFPKKGKKLKEGDLVTLDTVIEYKNYYLDSAITFGIGNLNKNKQKLMETTKLALDETIKKVKPGIKVGVLSHTMQKIVENAGFSVLTNYAGHGIGREMHEPPEIPCFGRPHNGTYLKEGMVLAIEPLVCEKNNRIDHINHWQTQTADGGNFAQFEHTVLVTDTGYEILTK